MRNHSSVLFTAPRDIFFPLETPQGGCFSWLLGKRGAPRGIAWPGARRLGAARQHFKGSQGHQKRTLATSMSEGRAAGTSSGPGMREEHQEPAEMSSKQRHPKLAPLQRRFQTCGPEHTTAPLLIKQLLGRERAGRGGLPAMPVGLNNPKEHPKGFTSPEQQASHSTRGSEGSF